MFRRLPDRGYAFARVLGLVTVTYITWIVGSFLPIAGGVVLPGLVSVAGFVGWALRGRQVLRSLAQVKTAVVVEESLFLAGLIAWSALRAYVFHPDIAHTEQFMDMAFLSATLHAGSFPPLDPWMSGHTINYYYLGYLMNAILIRFSGVAPAVGYNLALSTIFALTLSGAYSLGYFLTRRLGWASVMPLFVVVLGNWHAVLVQLPQHQFPASGNGWFFDSTRVVGGGATINEFPFFSLMLGDLHPHVMSLPVTLLAIALGATFLYAEREPRLRAARLLVAAVGIGMLFTINSWDFPTYLLLAGACIAAGGYLASDRPDWWKVPALSIVALAVASVVLYTPFFLHFRSLADGIGVVTTRSDIFQFIQVFGLFLAGAVLLVGSLAWLLQPEPESLDLSAERGSVTLGFAAGQGGLSSLVLAGGLIALAILASLFQLWPLLIDLVLGSAGAFVLWRVLNTNQPRPNDVLALTAVGVACLVLALTELIYLRDVFAGGADYRMNTVFKFYYQAWVLLGLAGAYGAYRGWGILRRFAPRGVALLAIGLLSLGAAGGAVYTVLAPATTYAGAGIQSLNGMAWLAKSAPGDYDAIVWLRAHASSHAVELEAVGNDYSTAARVSTFTGMPAVMGWIGHEQQWRIGNADIAVRAADVKTVYTTTNESVARRLLYHYRVQYVIVGQQERDIQGVTTASLDKFGHFMRLAFRSHGTSIYTWR